MVKKSMKYFQVPSTEEWRIVTPSELLSDTLEIPGFTNEEIEELTAISQQILASAGGGNLSSWTVPNSKVKCM